MNEQLLEALDRLSPEAFSESCARTYRADRDPLSGEGAARHGGRYNPVGVQTLYLGKPESVAVAEHVSPFERRRLRFPPPGRFVVAEIQVDLDRVVNLTNSDTIAALGMTQGELVSSQHGDLPHIGEAANYLGFDAVVAPSARARGLNIAIYLDHAANKLTVIGEPEPVVYPSNDETH